MPNEEALFEIPAVQHPPETLPEAPVGPLKLKAVGRDQFRMLTLNVDTLISADHKARVIWELTGKLDLSQFQEGIRSQVGRAGREHTDPRLLVALWLYAYSEAINSAREISG